MRKMFEKWKVKQYFALSIICAILSILLLFPLHNIGTLEPTSPSWEWREWILGTFEFGIGALSIVSVLSFINVAFEVKDKEIEMRIKNEDVVKKEEKIKELEKELEILKRKP